MKYKVALKIIEEKEYSGGYIVDFIWVETEGNIRKTWADHFPDKDAGEKLIPTEEEAWELAKRFAAGTVGECIDIGVVREDFTPVEGCLDKMIRNR